MAFDAGPIRRGFSEGSLCVAAGGDPSQAQDDGLRPSAPFQSSTGGGNKTADIFLTLNSDVLGPLSAGPPRPEHRHIPSVARRSRSRTASHAGSSGGISTTIASIPHTSPLARRRVNAGRVSLGGTGHADEVQATGNSRERAAGRSCSARIADRFVEPSKTVRSADPAESETYSTATDAPRVARSQSASASNSPRSNRNAGVRGA